MLILLENYKKLEFKPAIWIYLKIFVQAITTIKSDESNYLFIGVPAIKASHILILAAPIQFEPFP
jgi:hypothetical protein